MNFRWQYDGKGIDWVEMADLYRIAPLGDKEPEKLKEVYENSLFKCFVFEGGKLVGVGRALADGVDCSYICDVAVHPNYQGAGLGMAVINKLRDLSSDHEKIILYANPSKEGFYKKLGFLKMSTAMAIFKDQSSAEKADLVE